MNLSNIRIILVNTSHPGNIGSAARAMKTMGLTQLYLVAPKFFPHPKALELASNADDILHNAVVVDELNTALTGCNLVFGTSARDRRISLPALNPRQASELVCQQITKANTTVAIIFGREHSGLTNEEIMKCNYQINIPSNSVYSSLNLAAAVQVICYEFKMASEMVNQSIVEDVDLAPAEDIENFYQHLQLVLQQIKFLRPEVPRQLMTRFRRLFNRVKLETSEVNILRGVLTAIQRSLKDDEND